MWSVVFGWTVVGIVIGLLIGAGFSVMSMAPPQLTLAKVFFTASAIVFILRLGIWLMSIESGTSERLLLSGLLFGVAGILWVEAVRWVTSVESAQPAGNSLLPPAAADEKAKDPFHMAIESVIAGGSRGRVGQYDPTTVSGIWITFQGSYGLSAAPASMAMFVRITNLLNRPQQIESLSYEALSLNTGDWHKLTRLSLRSRKAFYGFDNLKAAFPLDFSENGLDTQIADKPIDPGPASAVRGWELLEFPDDFMLSGAPVRCTIKNTLGREYITVLPFPPKDKANSNTMTRSLVKNGPHEDLSSYHRDYWSNMHAR
jgi:hypothetical protein